MNIVKAILFFYKKIFIPTIFLAGLLGIIGLTVSVELFLKTFGISYLFLGFLFHYVIYELRNKNEYYFYYNLGFSKLNLWIVTFVFGLITALFFIIL